MKIRQFFFSFKFIFLLLVFVAFILRYFSLDFQSLWLDEIYTMNMGDPANSIPDIYALSKMNDPLSVLYFILLNLFFKIVGFTSFAARFFSLIFGLAGVWFIYLLGKELRNASTGIIAALLLSVNFFHINYSQEARVYTMFMAFSCLSFFTLVRFIKNPGSKTSIYYGLSALLMLLSHFFGLFSLVAQGGIILISTFYVKGITQKKFIMQSLLSALIVIVGFLPVLPIFLMLTKATSSWIPPIANNALEGIFNGFFGGSYLVILFAGMFIIYFLVNVFSEKTKEDNENTFQNLTAVFCLLTIWILGAFLIPYYNSFIKLPMLVDRYMISFLPALLMMMAIGLDMVAKVKLRIALVVLFATLSILEIALVKAYYKTPTKATFREASQFLMENNASKSRIVTTLAYHFDYYFRKQKNTAQVDNMPYDTLLDRMRHNRSKLEAFWAIDGHGRGFSMSDTNKRYLQNNFDEIMMYEGISTWARFYMPLKKNDTSHVFFKLNASNFFDKIPYEFDDNLYLYNNGFITSKSFQLGSGNYRMVIKSRSTPANPIQNVTGHVIYYINDKKIGNYFIQPASFIYGDTLPFSITEKKPFHIKIEFDNDVMLGDEDRNVIIRELKIIKAD